MNPLSNLLEGESVVVHIDPEADLRWRDTLGNLTLVPPKIKEILEVATRQERLHVLGVACVRKHHFFSQICATCLPQRRAVVGALMDRWTKAHPRLAKKYGWVTEPMP